MAKSAPNTARATRGTKALVDVFTAQLESTPDRYRRDAGIEAVRKLTGIVKSLPRFKESAAEAKRKTKAVQIAKVVKPIVRKAAPGKKLGRQVKVAPPALSNGAAHPEADI